MNPLCLSKAGGTVTAGEPSQTLTAGNVIRRWILDRGSSATHQVRR